MYTDDMSIIIIIIINAKTPRWAIWNDVLRRSACGRRDVYEFGRIVYDYALSMIISVFIVYGSRIRLTPAIASVDKIRNFESKTSKIVWSENAYGE